MSDVASIVLPNGMDEEEAEAEGTSQWKNEGNRSRRIPLPLLTRSIYLCCGRQRTSKSVCQSRYLANKGSLLKGSLLKGSLLKGSLLKGSLLKGSLLKGSLLKGSLLFQMLCSACDIWVWFCHQCLIFHPLWTFLNPSYTEDGQPRPHGPLNGGNWQLATWELLLLRSFPGVINVSLTAQLWSLWNSPCRIGALQFSLSPSVRDFSLEVGSAPICWEIYTSPPLDPVSCYTCKLQARGHLILKLVGPKISYYLNCSGGAQWNVGRRGREKICQSDKPDVWRKGGSRTREGEREEEAVKIKKPAPLRGFPPRRMLSSFLPSLTHSRGKNEVAMFHTIARPGASQISHPMNTL